MRRAARSRTLRVMTSPPLESSADLDDPLDAPERTLRSRADRGVVERVRPGTFAVPGLADEHARHRRLVRATAETLDPDTVVSHVSAAAIHGLPVLRKRLERVTVVRPGSNGQRTKYVHARRARLEPHEIDVVDGVTVTSMARTVADLSASLPFGEALAIADAALRRGLARDRIVARGKWRRRIEMVIEHASPLAESAGESLSRALFIPSRLPQPVLQYRVFDARGRQVARCDFGWPQFRVVGEFDGDLKYSGMFGEPADVIRNEKHREGEIRDAGFDVVRWWWSLLYEGDRVERRVQLALDRATGVNASIR